MAAESGSEHWLTFNSKLPHDQERPYYEYDINWIEGCKDKPQGAAQYATGSQTQPGDPQTCEEFFVAAYESCDNGGVGGYIDVVCLRYTFTGGRTLGQIVESFD